MGALDGTINTPFGNVQKKTALIVGGGAAVILGIVWWRTNQMNAEETDIYDAEINPATGYPYGSPEDAAALLAQSQYVSPPSGGTGGGGYPPGSTGFTNNAQWTQAVIEYMTTAGLIEDPTLLSAALGAYITGAPVTTAQRSLIEQAIAAQGFPPLSGPNGYPPSINTAPVVPPTTTPPTTPPVTPTKLPPPIGMRISVPLGVDLYKWTDDVKKGYNTPYSITIMRSLNPGIDYHIAWIGTKSPYTPVFRKDRGGIGPVRIR